MESDTTVGIQAPETFKFIPQPFLLKATEIGHVLIDIYTAKGVKNRGHVQMAATAEDTVPTMNVGEPNLQNASVPATLRSEAHRLLDAVAGDFVIRRQDDVGELNKLIDVVR